MDKRLRMAIQSTWPILAKVMDPAQLIPSGTTLTNRAGTASVSFTILGVCYSMKNSKTPVRNSRVMIKHSKALQFERDFALQVPVEAKRGLGSRERLLRAIITVWYPSWRQDVDFALIYDLLQKTGVVSNDRWIRERHEYAAAIDSKNPRCEIVVEEI